MLKFIAKRLGYVCLTLIIVSFINFMIIRAIPGDPLGQLAAKLPEQVKANFYAKYGLDKPVMEQYVIYMKNIIVHGDLGESLQYPGRKVSKVIADHAPVSFKLSFTALAIGLTIGVILGLLAALKRGKATDQLVMFIAILGIAVPGFVFASVFQYFFTVKLRWFPTLGSDTWRHFVLPTFALIMSPIAVYARYMRSSSLEVLGQDYILTARSKGVSRGALIFKHLFRNSILPIITIVGPRIATLFTGSLVIENIFGIPGLGFAFVGAITNRDYTMIMSLSLVITCVYVLSLVIVDIVYGLVDPRIRVGGGRR